MRAAEEITGQVKQVQPDHNRLTVTRGLGKEAKEQEFLLQPGTRIVDGLNELKEVVPLKEELRAELFQTGASVRIATLTDRDGILKIQEVWVVGRPLFRKSK